MQSPYKDLNWAIINVISSETFNFNTECTLKFQSKKKRVQNKSEEILTSEEVAAHLKVQEEKRKAKKKY